MSVGGYRGERGGKRDGSVAQSSPAGIPEFPIAEHFTLMSHEEV